MKYCLKKMKYFSSSLLLLYFFFKLMNKTLLRSTHVPRLDIRTHGRLFHTSDDEDLLLHFSINTMPPGHLYTH